MCCYSPTKITMVIDGMTPFDDFIEEIDKALGTGCGKAGIGLDVGLTDDEIEAWTDRSKSLASIIFERLLRQHKKVISERARLNTHISSLRATIADAIKGPKGP